MELLEAFVDISKMFDTSPDPLHQITMSDCTYGLIEVEANIFFCIGISTMKPLPTTTTTTALSTTSVADDASIVTRLYRSLVGNGDVTLPTTPTPTKYIPKSPFPPHRDALRAILQQTYSQVRFFCGPLLDRNMGQDDGLLQRLITLCLQDVYNSEALHCAPLRCLQGIEHLPIDRTTFLSVQSFIHFTTSQSFCSKHGKMILFANQMVWSSLEDSFEAYSFLQRFFRLPTPSSSSSPQLLLLDDGYLPLGRVLVSNALQSASTAEGTPIYFPAVYFTGKWRRMAALKVKRTVLVLFSDFDAKQEDADLRIQLQRFKQATLGELDKVNGMLEESFKRIIDDQATNAFVYANQTNLVMKSTTRFQHWTKSPVLQDAMLPLTAMRAFHLAWLRIDGSYGNSEMAVYVCGEWCVTAWRSGERRLFRFSAARMADSPALLLTGVEHDLQKLLASKFSNVVMF